MDEMIIAVVAIFFTVGVPVLAFAAHFALRPLVRDLTQALGPRRQDRETIARLTERIAELERQGRDRDERLAELADAELFRRQLEDPSGSPKPGP